MFQHMNFICHITEYPFHAYILLSCACACPLTMLCGYCCIVCRQDHLGHKYCHRYSKEGSRSHVAQNILAKIVTKYYPNPSRVNALFLPDSSGQRPSHGNDRHYITDPNWKDLILFYEYFHGDNGAGCGAT